MRYLAVALLCFYALGAVAADPIEMTYKRVAGRDLKAYVFMPSGHIESAEAPVVIFFHGGGWRRGSPESGFGYGEFLVERGIVFIAFEYRFTTDPVPATLDEIIGDAKSAVRWTRQQAPALGIDPARVISSGHSSGGYLAVSVGLLTRFEPLDENQQISSKVNAMILLAPFMPNPERNPALLPEDIPTGEFLPRSYVSASSPPALWVHGDADTVALPEVSIELHTALRKVGADSQLVLIKGSGHAFRGEDSTRVKELMSQFIVDLGYVD